MAELKKVEIGFEGGQVLPLRIDEEQLRSLRAQVEQGGWHDIETEEGTLSVYVGKIAFLRTAAGQQRVGF